MTRSAAVLFLGALMACGGGSTGGGGTGTASGTVAGVSFSSVAESVSLQYIGMACTGTNYVAGMDIFLSSAGGSCASLQNTSTNPPSGQTLFIELSNFGASAQVQVAPGTYPIGLLNTPSVEAIFLPTSTCGGAGYLAGSGTVTITTVTSSSVAGSYSLNFVDSNNASAGTLTGTFGTATCTVNSFCAATATDGGC